MSGPWMLTHTGRDHYLSGCGALLNHIEIADVAWHLAQINRFCGAAKRPYSVAEHSLLCADIAKHAGERALVQLLCLLHDAHEAYTGDLSTPAKNAVGLQWAHFEHLQADRVRRALGVVTGFSAHNRLVHHYDTIALATERRDLTYFDADRNRGWPVLDEPGAQVRAVGWVNLNELARVNARWTDWRDQFLHRYAELMQQAHDEALEAPLEPSSVEQ